MTLDQIAVIGLILVMFALFAWNKWRYDVVAVIALVALVALDAILGGETSKLVEEPKRVLEGFGHPAVVTVAAVLIISPEIRPPSAAAICVRIQESSRPDVLLLPWYLGWAQ